MAKDPFTRRLWLLLSTLSATIIIGIVLLILVLDDVSVRVDAIARSRATVLAHSDNLIALAALERDSNAAAVYVPAMDKLLPSEDSLVSFPEEIQQFAKSYGVTAQASFADASSEVAPSDSAPGSISFILSASGDPAALLTFLGDLETKSTQFLVAIDSANFQFTPGAHLTANGRVFFQ